MKINAGGVAYDFPLDLTMGELRFLKREFDLPHPRFLEPFDNLDHAAGLLFIAMKRRAPQLPDAAIMDRLNAVQGITFDATDEEIAAAEDEGGPPTEAAQAAPPTPVTEPADAAAVPPASGN